MERINAPAQTVEIRLDSGAWVDITLAIEGFCVPSWRVEDKTGEIICDQVRARVIVPFLEELGVPVRLVLEALKIDFRLFFHEATSGTMPTGSTPVFLGRVVELARLTKLRAGDTLDLTVQDLLKAGNERQPSAAILTDTEPARYDAVIGELAAEMDLTVGELHGAGFSTEIPYVTHHPRPSGADATAQIRGLAWWPVHGLLLYGVNESIWGYSPSTGTSYNLAVPAIVPITSVRQIETLWVDGTDVYGVSLPLPDATTAIPGYIVKADLSGFSPDFAAPPQIYSIYAEPFKLWNAGMARIKSTVAEWRVPDPGAVGDLFIYKGNAIGLGAPEDSEYTEGPTVFSAEFESELGTFIYSACARDFARVIGTPEVHYERASENPLMYGRNLFLPEETAVGVEFTESDKRPADVIAYRMPGPLAYFIPRSGEDEYGSMVYDVGNFTPFAEKVGTLPCTLPAGYYAFINYGNRVAHHNDPEIPHEYVSAFEISFTRSQRRPSVAVTSAGDEILTAEDDVDISTLDEPLGPLASSDADEFEWLYYRDLTAGTKNGIGVFPSGTHSIRITRTSDTEALAVFANEAGILGAYNRTAFLTELLLFRLYKLGSSWQFYPLTRLGGQTGNDDQNVYYHYAPTSLAYLNGKAYVGYTRTTQRFIDLEGAPVVRAYVNWEGGVGSSQQKLGDSIIEVNAYLVDDIKKGDRIRLWPHDPNALPYAPLPRTVLDVEWVSADRITKITISPTLDCSDGAFHPPDRVIKLIAETGYPDGIPGWSHTKGVEEYDAEFGDQWGPDSGPPILQREAEAREVRTYFRAYNLSTDTWEAPIDFGREDVTENLTAEDDPENQRTTLSLSNTYPDTSTIEVKLGDSPVGFTVDTDGLYETGDCVLGLPRRYVGLELSVTYSYWDASQRFTEATVAGSSVYYTRGKELRSWALVDSTYRVVEHGEVHYQASGTASPLVIPAAVSPVTVYGVAEGGGNLPFQLSINHSLNVGDRSGWSGKGLASCLAEVALALGCIFWVDGSGVIHFVPRGWHGGEADVLPEDVLDYQEPGAWQRAAPAVTVSWPGGEETAGVLSATRITDNESFSAPLVTSAGWANLLANLLYMAKSNRGGRAEVTLGSLRLDIEMGNGLHVPLTGAVSPNDGIGVVVGIEPQLNFGQAATRFTLELED
ncbi:MAG: hypothetical protein NTW26_01350 [bacterium]|nr:hypothetical protein [bacterium]